jgi:hypothetical protein
VRATARAAGRKEHEQYKQNTLSHAGDNRKSKCNNEGQAKQERFKHGQNEKKWGE